MPFRTLAGAQGPVCETVPQFQRMLGWMEDFAEPCMIAGKELGTIGGSDLEHGSIPLGDRTALSEDGHCTVGEFLRSSSPSALLALASPPNRPVYSERSDRRARMR